MKKHWLKIGSLVVLLSFSAITQAQESMSTIVAARSGAIGAGTAATNLGSEALLWNPAGLVGQPWASISFTHYDAFQEFTYDQLEGYYPNWLAGNWGVRLLMGRTDAFTEFNLSGQAVDTVNFQDILVALGYAFPIGSNFSMGLSSKINHRQLADYENLSGALDLGIIANWPNQPLTLGVAVNNLGFYSALREESGTLNLQLRAGLAYDFKIDTNHHVLGLIDIFKNLESAGEVNTAMGLEYNLANLVFLRGSYNIDHQENFFSFGAGLRWIGIGLDYNFQSAYDLGDHHRFTLSYYFEQAQSKKPYKPQIKKQLLESYKVKDLKVAPRHIKSKVTVNLKTLLPKVNKWHFEIITWEGDVVKTFAGSHTMPAYLRWDGKNNLGKYVDDTTKYKTRLYGDNKLILERPLVGFEPAVKMKFKTNNELVSKVMFVPKHRFRTKQWALTIVEATSKKEIKNIEGKGMLPNRIIWDGSQKDHRLANQKLDYAYELVLLHRDGTYSRMSEVINSVEARLQIDDQGNKEIRVKGVLFDFDSAIVNPQVMDKIIAVIQAILLENRKFILVCEGHADEVGSHDYNYELSRDRAKMVAKVIQKKAGLKKSEIIVKGYGYQQPIVTGGSKQRRSKNRRVEIILKPKP